MFRSKSYYRMMRSLDEALAYRKDGIIYVLIIGELPTPCDEAKVVDKYPGTRTYVRDPGSAELFIEIGRKPGYEDLFCIQTLIPFFIGEEIQDSGHDTVTIYVNGEAYKRIPIEEKSSLHWFCENRKMH